MLQDLASVSIPQQLRSNKTAIALTGTRFPVRISNAALQLALSYLQSARMMLLLNILNRHIKFIVGDALCTCGVVYMWCCVHVVLCTVVLLHLLSVTQPLSLTHTHTHTLTLTHTLTHTQVVDAAPGSIASVEDTEADDTMYAAAVTGSDADTINRAVLQLQLLAVGDWVMRRVGVVV